MPDNMCNLNKTNKTVSDGKTASGGETGAASPGAGLDGLDGLSRRDRKIMLTLMELEGLRGQQVDMREEIQVRGLACSTNIYSVSDNAN
jgi:hypothetical protein